MSSKASFELFFLGCLRLASYPLVCTAQNSHGRFSTILCTDRLDAQSLDIWLCGSGESGVLPSGGCCAVARSGCRCSAFRSARTKMQPTQATATSRSTWRDKIASNTSVLKCTSSRVATSIEGEHTSGAAPCTRDADKKCSSSSSRNRTTLATIGEPCETSKTGEPAIQILSKLRVFALQKPTYDSLSFPLEVTSCKSLGNNKVYGRPKSNIYIYN